MKKIPALILCLAITAGMFITPSTVQAEDAKWDGKFSDYSWYDNHSAPYTISTAAQFAAFGNILNKMDGRSDRFAGKTIRLAADLDMGNMPFRAMGGHADDMAFGGTFEGQGHVISNLNITQAGLSKEYIALFSRLSSGGAIRDLGLEGVTVDVPGAANQAAFAGQLMDGSAPVTIENCFARDVNIKLTLPLPAGGRVGGFAASVTDYPKNAPNKIMNCYAVNVRLSRKSGEGSADYGFGHFAGLSEGGKFINCYSGGVTEQPSDSVLPNQTMSFGMLRNGDAENKGVAENNCYSDCYANDSGLDWFFGNGFKRGGSRVSTASLKGMTSAVNLGSAFVKAEAGSYNAGYPYLKWEEKHLEGGRRLPPNEPLTVESYKEAGKQRYNVTLSVIAGAEYRYAVYGKPDVWQDSNVFQNLPSGKYTFEARMKETIDKYPSQAITTDEITLDDLSVWDGVSADYSWYDNHSAPYTISTAAQFAAFGNILNKLDGRDDRFADKTIQLAADLDMSNKPFRAMGGTKEGQEFQGTFEGGGHMISNLNITECGLDIEYAALFVCIKNGGAVRNLGLEGVKINNVKGAINQAAFAGLLIGDNHKKPVSIENCFVRDVEFIISKDIEGGRIGGFVAVVSDWPQEPAGTYNSITNCYAVNVVFKGIGSNTWTLGYFAGPSDGGKFTNCYSGGVLNTDGFSVEKFGRLGDLAQVSNCYSDGADSGKIRFPFNGGGTQLSTAALKGRTGDDVNLGDTFLTIDHDFYNYGYPFLKWEKEKGNVKEGNGPLPAEPLAVESSEQAGDQRYDVTLNEITDAEYRYVTCGKTSDWQDGNIFTNLPSGKYTFEARMKETELYYPSDAITTDEETTLGDPSVWNGVSVDYSWYDGKESPYTISTAAQFAAFGNILNKLDEYNDGFEGKTILLAADLDMNCKPFRAMGGTETEDAFRGTFEGGGHMISNLNITECGLDIECAALFVCIKDGGAVRNLGVEGITIEIPGVVKYQAAFAGIVTGDSACTIENCFVRDVNINLTLPIRNGKAGGFAACVSNCPGDTQHQIMNCYSVNVRLFRKSGAGDVKYGFGYFAGLSEGGTFTNCYSGGIAEKPLDGVLPNKTLSFGILQGVAADNNCYSDCYADDNGFADSFADNEYKRGGKQVLTADLKGMTGGVDMGGGFKRIPGIHYNYGYPVLDWEMPAVYLAETGSDDNNGTSGNPVKTLEKALALVPRIGIIEVEGTVDVSESLTLENKIVFFRGSGKLNKIGSGRISGNGIVDFGSFTGDVASLNVFGGLEEVYGPWTIQTTGNYMVYLAAYSENGLEKVWCAAGNTSEPVDVTAADASLAAMGTTVYVWDDKLQPIIPKYTLGEKLQ